MPPIATIIQFPYSGYESGSDRQKNFWELVAACRSNPDSEQPIVILNMDTKFRGKAEAFFQDRNNYLPVDVQEVWSVDTCQMWLAGWGYVLENYPEVSRIVQVAGDVDTVVNIRSFLTSVRGFVAMGDPWDLIIGDFESVNLKSAKELIDVYGTFPLLANWFDIVAEKIQEFPIKKPRSEFLNIKVDTLLNPILRGNLTSEEPSKQNPNDNEGFLTYRKFAYEQTLNMIIHSWDFQTSSWKYQLHEHLLGKIQDDGSFRKYRDCLDQIERTERMLRLLWREMNISPNLSNRKKFVDFMDEYDRLDARSKAILETARITIRALLGT